MDALAPDGRWFALQLNAFGHEERALDAATAVHVIEETHGFWAKLRSGGQHHRLAIVALSHPQ